MLTTTLLLTAAAIFLSVALYRYLRAGRGDTAGTTEGRSDLDVLFETRIEPPFLRPVVTRLHGGELTVEAPVVHARLASDILVLDVKSGSNSRAEGFEIAITEFDPTWLDAAGYNFHAARGHLLVGPQGEITDRLLRRAAREHELALPTTGGNYVQIFELEGIVTDPAEFTVEFQGRLPSGEPVTAAYEYASATVHLTAPAAALTREDNYQPLGVKLQAA